MVDMFVSNFDYHRKYWYGQYCKCFMLIVLERPFFVVELRRRIASSHQAGTSTKSVRIYLLVNVPVVFVTFSCNLPFLIACTANVAVAF